MKNKLNKNKLVQSVKLRRGNLSLRDISSELGISPSTLSRVERGMISDIETLIVLCDWLNLPVGDFFCDKDDFLPVDDPVPKAPLINDEERTYMARIAQKRKVNVAEFVIWLRCVANAIERMSAAEPEEWDNANTLREWANILPILDYSE